MGVTITAWLVNPQVGRPVGFVRSGTDWSGADAPADPNADDWSSSWDYAGPDGADGADDDRWESAGGDDNISWSVAPRGRRPQWSRARPGR
ncbi:hypothetical protein FAGKG844_150041 [Frankia sp. AgKG'84/4]